MSAHDPHGFLPDIHVKEELLHLVEEVKPLLRGMSHLLAFPTALLATALVVAFADGGRMTAAGFAYGASVSLVFGASAAYHRFPWRGRKARWMRRLDHAAIFICMAGTYTAFYLAALSGTLANVLLGIAWGGAFLGVAMKMAWIDAPRAIGAWIYLAFGLMGLLAVPNLLTSIGEPRTLLLVLSGVVLFFGGLCYVAQRPNLKPHLFGFHELFHLCTIIGIGIQFAVLASVVT